MAGFIFGAGTPYKSHADVMRQREIANALIQQSQAGASANSIPEGVANLGVGIMAALMGTKARRDEAKGKASYNDRFKAVTRSLLGGQGPQASGPFKGTAVPTSAPPPGGKPSGNVSPEIVKGIQATAQSLGIDPVDLATAISYETAGTFDPAKKGPTTKWGTHRGLIQFGEPQASQYGVDWNNPVGSQLGPEGAVAKYLKATGVKPGMGLLDIYSAINAGGVGLYNRSDAAAGGAPGTVADKVRDQMDGHRAKAVALLGGSGAPPMVQMASAAPSSGIGPMGFQAPQMPVQAPPVSQPQIVPASAPPPQMAPAAPAMGNQPMTAYQRTFARSQEREGGNVGPIARGQMARVMGQDPAQAMAPPQGGQPMAGGRPAIGPEFVAAILPANATPDQAAEVNGVVSRLDAMSIEQLIELANSPYAEDWQKEMLQMYIKTLWEKMNAPPPDPLDQRTKELNIAKLERDLQPEPKARPATVEEKRRLNLPDNAPVMVKPDGTVEIIDTSKINPQQSDPTTNMRELAQINQERAARGQPPLLMEDFLRSKRGNGITIGPDGSVQIGGSGMKLTEQQSKDVGFYNRASQIAPILDEIDVNLTQALSAGGSMVPGVGNFLQSDAYRQARQAAEEFIIALLRKDTGAAVTDGEMSLYGSTYLPRAGDDETTIKQKREARGRALEGIRMGLGPAEILIRERELNQSGGSGTPPPDQTGQSEFTPDQIAKAKDVFGLKTDAEAIQRLTEKFKAVPAPPGVDPEDWKFMTPQERALWQN